MRLPSAFLVLVIFFLGNAWAEAAPPTFYQPVVGATLAHGSNFTFQAAMNGTPPFTWSWKHNSQPVTTGTSVFYGLSGGVGMLSVNGSATTAGTYSVTVTNAEGSITSPNVTLVVVPSPPSIYQQPAAVDKLADASDSTTLSIGVSGMKPLVIQWQKNGRGYGAPVTSYDGTSSITFPSVAASSGDYRCLISNADGSATSSTAHVHFWTSTGLVQNVKHRVALIGDSVQLSASVFTLDQTLYFQWQHNGQNIPGANDFTLNVTVGSLADAGDYRTVLQTENGTYFSDAANLSVVGAQPPAGGALGKTAAVTLAVSGKNLGYAWYSSGGAIAATNRHYSGQATSRLSILAASQADTGLTYRCKVWGIENPAVYVFSESVALSLETLPPAIDPVVLADAGVAQAYTAQVTGNGSIFRFAASGLPAGVVCDPASGLISGTPRVPGVYHVRVSATNPVGTTYAPYATLNVTAFPTDLTATIAGPLLVDGQSETFATLGLSVTKAGVFSGRLSITYDLGVLHTLPFTGGLSGTADQLAGVSTPVTLGSSWEGVDPGSYVVTLQWSSTTGWAATLGTAGGPVFANLYPHVSTWNVHTNSAASYAGYYTLELKGSPSPTLPAEAGGSGWGTFTLKTDGTLSFSGRLQDGSAFVVPAFIDSTGDIWVHAWLYGSKGQFEADLGITLGDPANQGWDNALGGGGYCVRPPSPIVQPDYATPITNAYFTGFQMQYIAIGSKYLPPSNKVLASTACMLSAGSYVYGSAPNISLIFNTEDTYPDQPDALYYTSAYLRTNHTALFDPYVAGDSIKFGILTFNAATGLFGGAFTQYLYNADTLALTGTRTLTYQGVVTRADAGEPAGYGAGYFLRAYTDVQVDPGNARNISKVNLFTSRGVSMKAP